MRKEFLEVGEIVGTHGVRGEMKLNPWCDSPDFVKRFKVLYFDDEGKKPIKINSCRVHKNVVLLKLDGVEDMNTAENMRNTILYICRDDANLADGEYFLQELFGCKVLDFVDENIEYGIITDVSSSPAQTLWHIEKDGREYLFPAVDEFVKFVDIDACIVKIAPIKGMFD
jgi:16S rRNA processing protein RimM